MWSGSTPRASTGSLRPARVAFRSTSRPLRTTTLSRVPVKATNQQPASSSAFFNRKTELNGLQLLRKSQPSQLKLLLGPRSCGKTALLVELLKDKRNAMLIDCRGLDAKTPAAFFAALLEQLGQAAPEQVGIEALLGMLTANLPLAARVFFSGMGMSVQHITDHTNKTQVTHDVKKLVEGFTDSIAQNKQPVQVEDANEVIKAFQTVLAAWEQDPGSELADCRPMLIIDEVNRLTQWKDFSPETLGTLLAYFVKISKQEKRCHVVLATSEYAFQHWLRKEVGDQFFGVIVIGDFPEADARLFFEERLRERETGITLDDAAWHKVYERCGGNAGFLISLVELLKCRTEPLTSLDDWLVELSKLAGPVKMGIRELLRSGGGQDWTRGQFAAAALELLRTPGHAVPQDAMIMLLGQLAVGPDASEDAQIDAGTAALQSLVKANALAVRPFSEWAQDIPAAAFKDDCEDDNDVVTAPSAMHLHCMHRIEPRLTKLARKARAAWRPSSGLGDGAAGD